MRKKKPQSSIQISEEDLAMRTISTCPGSHNDYPDEGYRRIFPVNDAIEFRNEIFVERIGICLNGEKLSIKINNCEFQKGLFIRRGNVDVDYDIFIYKSHISEDLTLHSFEAKNKISIDSSIIQSLMVSGKSEEIDLFNSQIDKLIFEYLSCAHFKSERTDLGKFSLYKFNAAEVDFDEDNIAISDYSRLIKRSDQTRKQTSEVYHRFALKAVRTIKASREVNYQLTKATMSWIGIFFGYFFKPVQVILWMLASVILYGVIYWVLFDKDFFHAVYFSAYTFLTIGYGDLEDGYGIVKTILVFSEGLLGITYAAALLTSIINYAKK